MVNSKVIYDDRERESQTEKCHAILPTLEYVQYFAYVLFYAWTVNLCTVYRIHSYSLSNLISFSLCLLCKLSLILVICV